MGRALLWIITFRITEFGGMMRTLGVRLAPAILTLPLPLPLPCP